MTKWEDLTTDEKREWAGENQTQAFVALVRDRHDALQRALAMNAVSSPEHELRASGGKLAGYDEIIDLIEGSA